MKYESLSEDNKSLFEENKIYCVELTKIIYDNEKGQEAFKSLKLRDLQKSDVTDRYIKHKNDIERLVQEWEGVKNIYDIISQIASESDIIFRTENFRDKKYVVIQHENYTFIKNTFNKNIKQIDEHLLVAESFKYSTKTLLKFKNFKNSLTELYDIVENMEINQLLLEKNMLKSIALQKNAGDLFFKLKQAEQYFKGIIDFIVDQPRVMEVLKVKDVFKDSLHQISTTLSEIPASIIQDSI